MSLSLADVAEIVGKQFWRMVLVGSLCAAGAGWALLSMQPTFEARTLLLYKLGREYLYVPDVVETSPGVRSPDPGDLMQIIGAEMQIVVNRELRRRFIEEFGVDRIFPGATPETLPIDTAIEALRSIVTVALIPNTLMVELRVRHGDPATAAEMANLLVDFYLDRRGAVFLQRDSDYFRARLENARLDVERMDAKIRGLLDGADPLVFETNRDILIGRQATIEAEIAAVETNISSIENRRQKLEADVAALTATVVEYRTFERNPIVAEADSRIVALQAQRTATAASLGASHPTVRALEREIEGLREVLKSAPAEIETGGRTGTNPARQRSEIALADATVELRELEARRAHLLREREVNAVALARAASVSSELAAMQRAVNLQLNEVARFDARLRDSLSEETQGRNSLGSVRILERASPPAIPIGAPISVRLIAALLFGGVIGLAAGVLSYLARPTILTPRMLEQRLEAPVLAEISWRRRGRSAMLEAS